VLDPELSEPFRCEIEPARGHVAVVPRGEVDVASVGEIEAALRELRESGFNRLVLDLRHVTFMDSTGLRLMLAWDEEARRDGMEFGLVAGGPAVQRLLEIAGVRARLTFVDPAALR
jgi:anti-sigma B factor antagonist